MQHQFLGLFADWHVLCVMKCCVDTFIQVMTAAQFQYDADHHFLVEKDLPVSAHAVFKSVDPGNDAQITVSLDANQQKIFLECGFYNFDLNLQNVFAGITLNLAVSPESGQLVDVVDILTTLRDIESLGRRHKKAKKKKKKVKRLAEQLDQWCSHLASLVGCDNCSFCADESGELWLRFTSDELRQHLLTQVARLQGTEEPDSQIMF